MQQADFADLDAFTAVARSRGFRAAAALRNVSASSLSEAIRRLETRLGVRLLNRTTRSVTPTEAGQKLLERLSPALADVALALDEVNAFRDSPTGTLRLNVPVVVAKVMMPRLIPRFLAQNPGVAVEIVAEDNFIDVLAAGYDAGVRYDERLEKDMIAVPLSGPQRFVVVGSPAYFVAHGRPTHPRDVLDHACIRHRFASGVSYPWEFEKDGEVIRLDPPGRLTTTDADLKHAACEAGVGLLATFEDFVAEAVAAGRLEAVLEDWLPPFTGPYLYYPSRRHMPAPLRAFVDFVKAERGA
ncbi:MULTISPECIES: LysR family transcriptional regulator [unclassified Caulobacter]|uniref:LysR family transcriptional regulator n=1 Tax=unclassified Caulobacter TaxID=2648921 RepID=UPI0006F38CE4|nr:MULTISPECIES: LysR family transcriptional regulator [unclassified Caulobacter]KQV62387.1 LysR family transcriptional regulator [Caulobacter sp. Root342]KQV65603.1 LysR family transcriptional regulator [Caulobacter sp. Root343]